jgi:tol-pal system protein YbgF
MDPVEARYRAAYGLYTGGDYPAAAKSLAAFVAANPKHPRASNAQFWNGRALLAAGETALAAKAFLAGYQNYPRGERAHNSLLWLGKSLIELRQPKAACQALDQLRTAYPDRLTGQVASDAAAARAAAGCGA